VPRGCALVVLSMTEGTVLSYKADNDYSPAHERTLLWNDKTIGIAWPKMDDYLVSKKDLAGSSFEDAEKFE